MENTKKKNWLVRLWNYFTLYEKIWFSSILILTILCTILFPEDSEELAINPKLVMMLYIIDIISNVACELLISKQSKWNFMVSLLVEFTEIALCIVCAYRWATCAVTLFFWIPIDIASFFFWQKHKDRKEESLTKVKKLNWWQDLILVASISVWTVVVGYLISMIDAEGILSYNEAIKDAGAYLDACASAIGIANGVFILLRYREQWIAWYLVTFIEIVLNIMAGQWILLVLKFGYLTNTTYGYIKWTKYIKSHERISDPTLHDKKSFDTIMNVCENPL